MQWRGCDRGSPSSTRTARPPADAENTTQTLRAASATLPTEPGSSRPLPLTVACEKHQAIAPGVIAMPAEPTASSGSRPILSTGASATGGTGTLTVEMTTVTVNESASLKPTECHGVAE